MSKPARIAYDFTPFPRKLHPGWAGRSHASWGLCLKLWMLADGQPIQVHGADWRASLCQQMGIGGRDRPTTRALMADLQSDGLMSVAGGFVTVVFHPGPVVEEYDRGSTGVVPGVRQESYPQELKPLNYSGVFLQTDRQTEETDGRASQNVTAQSRSVTSPNDRFASSFGADEVVWGAMKAAYEKVRGAKLTTSTKRGPQFRNHAAALFEAATENTAASDGVPESTVESVLRVAFRAFYAANANDEWMVQRAFPLSKLSENFAEYFRKGRFEWETDPDWSLKQAKPEQPTGNSSFSTAPSSLASGGRR